MFNTEYYSNKFHGLANAFGDGCELINRSDAGFELALIAAIETAWRRAESLRPALRCEAARQILTQQQAYVRLSSILATES